MSMSLDQTRIEAASANVGADDLHLLDGLADADDTRVELCWAPGSAEGERRFKIYRLRPLSLTTVLPLFTHLGVEVLDERPYEVTRSDGSRGQIYDFGLRAADETLWGGSEGGAGRRFAEAFVAVWSGEAESDGFNALVLRGGLTWRRVVVLRAIAKYLRQAGSAFSQDYLEEALVANPALAVQLVELFEQRFDPDAYPDDPAGRQEAQAVVVSAITDRLADVASLDHDRIIRSFLSCIQAMLRTSYYQDARAEESPGGSPERQPAYQPCVSFKLDPRLMPELPEPRPQVEIWVYGPRVEGVHLRFGEVARGGLRWSDRREDFRTEVLGLVKAQLVKNAVIVPTGSKGGFVPKKLPPATDREAWLEEGIAAYRLFVSAMLDLTDNRVDGVVVPPTRVVRHDGDDPYLVVAADKGTASLSDVANDVARSHGFWLDDAFASGGSAGYDHKQMGITARGAWESVKRHFRELDLDVQSDDFTVVGIGDMSGDVFGNGMLLSEHIRLVAAFDHRHIFLDPDPDPVTSFAERKRLFDLPRSSWADYDAGLLSDGGGVFSRSAKAIRVSAQAAGALGLADGGTTMTPAELIRAILLAPVDLLWNGGIGTYVKATAESNVDAGDRTNDAIRVNGSELRCRVVGEGGNLGCTQLGRVEAALAGVHLNTDAIDNSAGVDTSDHEVNLKILLTGMTQSGELAQDQRDALLISMTEDVARAVLRDNYEQNVLLGNARAQQHSMLSVHRRLVRWLEDRGDLDRALEGLPGETEMGRRDELGLGLTSPEFAVVAAHTKLALKKDLLASSLPDEPWFESTLAEYFPSAVRDQHRERLRSHPLRRDIITNAVVNSMVNRGGITFAFRAMEETGASLEQVARAFVVCREVFDLAGYVSRVEELDNLVSTRAQSVLYLEFRRLLDRAVRWFVQNRAACVDVAGEVERYAPAVRELGPRIGVLLQGEERVRFERNVSRIRGLGIPGEAAEHMASLLFRFSLLDVVDVCAETGVDADRVAAWYFAISEEFGIDALLSRVTKLPRGNDWEAMARGALRDDLYAVLRGLTRAAAERMRSHPGDLPPGWLPAEGDDVVRRCRAVLARIERLEVADSSALAIAVRSLRTIADAGMVR